MAKENQLDISRIFSNLSTIKDNWSQRKLLGDKEGRWELLENDFKLEKLLQVTPVGKLISTSLKDSYVLAARNAILLKQTLPCQAFRWLKGRCDRLKQDAPQMLSAIDAFGAST